MTSTPPMGRLGADRSACADVRLVGADTEVMCADGRARRYVNLDYAASTTAVDRLTDALDAIVRDGPAMHYDYVTERDEYQPIEHRLVSDLASGD